MPAKNTTRRKAKKAAKRTKTAKKQTSRRATRPKAPAKRGKAKTPAQRAKVREGVVSHTEFASSDPKATQSWAQKVLGWEFQPPMETPAGPYHMFRFSKDMGGGIRPLGPGEKGGVTPFCEVPDIRKAFAKAVKAGAAEMMSPSEVPGGMGWIAVVQAPGGVPVGLWAPK